MAAVIINPTERVIRIDSTRDTFIQSINTCASAALHRKLQFVRIDRGSPGIIKIVYWDSHQLQYVIKTVQNLDEQGNPKLSFAGTPTWNAQKVRRYRSESDHLYIQQQLTEQVVLEPEPISDLAWKSDIWFFGVRDALLGSVPFSGKSLY